MLIAIKAFSNEKFDKISNEMDFLEIVDGHTLSRPLIKLVVQNDGSITGKLLFARLMEIGRGIISYFVELSSGVSVIWA